MIKTTKEKVTFEREKVIEKRCDICDRYCKMVGGFEEWGEDKGHIAEITIKYEKGVMEDDGTALTKVFEYDVCPTCFESKFPKFIGKNPRIKNGF